MTRKPDIDDAQAKTRRRAVMAGLLAENSGLIWQALRSTYPAGDADARVRRLGTMGDLFSEVYLVLLRLLHNYDPAKGKLSTWVGRSARRIAWRVVGAAGVIRVPDHALRDDRWAPSIERARRAQTGGSDEVALYWREAADASTPQPWHALACHDDVHALRKALAALPPTEQDVIRRYYFGRQDDRGVGAELGLSRQRAHQVRKHALARLREILAPLQDVL